MIYVRLGGLVTFMVVLALVAYWLAVAFIASVVVAGILVLIGAFLIVFYSVQWGINQRAYRTVMAAKARRAYQEQVATRPLDPAVFEAGVDATYVQNRGVNL